MNKEPTNQPMKEQVNEGTTYSGPTEGKMSLEAAALLIQTMDNHGDHSLLIPRQCLQPGACCLVTWLAWAGAGELQHAELQRAREHSWHHAQERCQR